MSRIRNITTVLALILSSSAIGACTRIIPPVYNVSTAHTPRLLLELNKPTWIGVRHAGGRLGVALFGTSFKESESVTCVYRAGSGLGFKFVKPNAITGEVEDANAGEDKKKSAGEDKKKNALLVGGQRCPARNGVWRLIAVSVQPGTGQSDPKPTSDGMICSHRCNRVRSRHHYMNIDVLTAEPARMPDPPPKAATDLPKGDAAPDESQATPPTGQGSGTKGVSDESRG